MIKTTRILVSVYLDREFVDEVNKHVATEEYKNASVAIRKFSKLGLQLTNYQKLMKDPEKANEFQQKVKEFVENEQHFEWAATLTTEQIEGFLMLLQMEKDERFKQQTLV